MTNKRFKIVTLGCRTNQYESNAYQTQLESLGYQSAQNGEDADICIVNTCTVTAQADGRSKAAIKKLLGYHPKAQIVVTGCLAERAREELLGLGSLHIVPNKEKEALIATLFPDMENLPEFQIDQFGGNTRAFVKVQDGCNSYCSYCIIPFVRGRSRSRPLVQIEEEVRQLVAKGFKEIVVTGINIGDYDGGDGSLRLHHLIQHIDNIEGVKRLRISSIDPDEVDHDLLEAVMGGKNTCPSMHIVLQSGSNSVLKRMRRKYTVYEFKEAVERLVAKNPDFTFTTDIIVGFPGESDSDFQESLKLIDETLFAKVHMFPYSDRPKTRSSRFEDKVPREVITERKSLLLRKAEEAAYRLREKFVGRVKTVLLEGKEKKGYITGHTDNFLLVHIPLQKGLRANTFVRVVLKENTPDGLIGEIID